jgi:hypothetical protein
MSNSNIAAKSHADPSRKKAPRSPKEAADTGGMLPDQEPTVIPTARKPLLSETEKDKERADWEGMTPDKPTENEDDTP